MPVEQGVGFSAETPRKGNDFDGLMRMHSHICKGRVTPTSPYIYVDLTAGPGWFEPAECQLGLFEQRAGYPSLATIAVETLREERLPYLAVLFEQNESSRSKLQHTIGDDPFVHYHEHNATASTVLEVLPSKCMGLVCVDPNGVPDFDQLARLSLMPQMERMDIVIHLAATSQKRARGRFARPVLINELQKVHKRHWLVMQPRDQQQWTWIVLTNWSAFPVWAKRKLYRVESTEGQQILDALTYSADEHGGETNGVAYHSYAEYLKHPQFIEVKQQAWLRAQGRCERCHERLPRDTHHLQYPKWGTFDVLENLLVVCHQCHCELHEKAN